MDLDENDSALLSPHWCDCVDANMRAAYLLYYYYRYCTLLVEICSDYLEYFVRKILKQSLRNGNLVNEVCDAIMST
jgi:hypothetical protein